MKLILPTIEYKKSYFEMVDEAIKNNDIKEMGHAYRPDETFGEMLKRLKDRREGKSISSRDVPSTVYWMLKDNEIVGTLDLRHKLNEDYYERLGHIAYYVRKKFRNNGYATLALKEALDIYKEHNIEKILVTCYDDNEASIKVIKKNNGKLECKTMDKVTNKTILKWWLYTTKKKIYPSVAWLTTNRTCNNKCKWCYANCCQDNNIIMDLSSLKKTVDELEKINIKRIILIGGEPTINKNICEIVKYINSKKIIVSMASNGRMFSDYGFASRMVKSGLKTCNISIKGSDENEYLKNTNSKGFEEMVSGYHNLKKLGIDVSMSYVLCDMNFEVFDKFLKTFKKNRLDNIIFQLYKPSVEGDGDYNAPTINDLAKLCKYVYYEMKKTNIKFMFEMSIPLCSLEEELLRDMMNSNSLSTCCHISKGKGIIFDCNFDLLPCNHFVNHPLNKEKINSKEIVDFWNSDDCIDFRKIVNTYPSLICQNCSLWKMCGGGCFLRWLSCNPSDYINDKYVKEVKK